MENLIVKENETRFLIECDEEKNHILNFTIYKVIEWDSDNEISKYELYLSGYIKWDGCIELHYSETHFCGYYDLLEYKEVLDTVWKKAENEIERFDKSVAY